MRVGILICQVKTNALRALLAAPRKLNGFLLQWQKQQQSVGVPYRQHFLMGPWPNNFSRKTGHTICLLAWHAGYKGNTIDTFFWGGGFIRFLWWDYFNAHICLLSWRLDTGRKILQDILVLFKFKNLPSKCGFALLTSWKLTENILTGISAKLVTRKCFYITLKEMELPKNMRFKWTQKKLDLVHRQ